MELKKDLTTALKGFAMGAANVIPGVSGGTIALLTGIFTRIIDSLNSIMEVSTWKMLFKGDFKGFWKKIDGEFLVALAVGVLVSIFSLAKLMKYVLEYHPVQTWAFFFGMIAASAVFMLIDVKGWKLKDAVWAVLGIVLGVVICTLSPTSTTDDLWFIFVCGAIAICTMILPGISGSFILLLLGKYEYIMTAISELNWPVLIVFAIGCAIGILAFSKFLHWLLGKYERETMLVLVGFVIGSLIKVWPWNDAEAMKAGNILTGDAPTEMHITAAIIWAVAGVILVWLLEFLGNKKKTPQTPTE